MKLLIALSLLFSTESSALESARASADSGVSDYELTCMTEPPTTTFGIWREGEEMIVRAIHHFGARFAPSFNGIYTPNDIPYLAEQAKLVLKMPAITTFHWPLKNCSLKGEVLKCFGTDDVQEGEGGAKLKPFGVHTAVSTEETIAGKHEYTTVSLNFDVDGKSGPRLEMKYPKGQCARGDSEMMHRVKAGAF
jgi:hypothetical protein